MSSEIITALGLMSGTSADGIDCAVIRSNGDDYIENIGTHFLPYPGDFRATLLECARQNNENQAVKQELAQWHVTACKEMLKKIKTPVDIISSHGHTIAHRPDLGWTKQIDVADILHQHFNIPVVSDLRQADMKNGGNGAPLVPIYHYAITKNQVHPIAIVNIGGVSNVTIINNTNTHQIIAFDAGTGNALLDDVIRNEMGKNHDENGALALSGIINFDVIAYLMLDPFFQIMGAKSLDRNHFADKIQLLSKLNTADKLATLAYFTANSIATGITINSASCKQCVIIGGGVKNMAIMRALHTIMPCPVVKGEEIGLNSDFIEAEAFAYIGIRSFKNIPYSFPSTTGVKSPTSGGVWTGRI